MPLSQWQLQAQILPPPPNNTHINNAHISDTHTTTKSPHSIGLYAKLGLQRPTLFNIALSNAFGEGLLLVPGISFYYGWHTPNGLGIEVALEYEYILFFQNSFGHFFSLTNNFFTPALYFSSLNNSNITWRIGLGYDMSLPSKSFLYHGPALLASAETVLNKKNAIGVFFKCTFHFDTTYVWYNTGTSYSHAFYIVGLSYRFNAGL